MGLRLFNTLSRKKEIFKPMNSKKVGIYTCGPTVYWYQHIGNLRSYVFPDILKKTLKEGGFQTKQVINITDVGHLTSNSDTGEDKIEKAAKKEGKTAKAISQRYFSIFKKDLEKMNISNPDIWAKATEHIKEQINLIAKLEKKGYTYKTTDGIYFDTSKLKAYGKLAKINIEGLEAGRRISLGEKKNKTDFALWKFSKTDDKEKRQQEWKSPWGLGFPGWHIECSAMSMKYLGDSFDIHTGGEDHIPIHHTNEIAQSEAVTNKQFVKYWLHGAFLMFKGEKISKSKGKFHTLSELEEKGFSALDLRYFFMSAHYRKPLNFTLENLEYAKNSLKRLNEIISNLKKESKINNKRISQAYEQFLVFVNDDLNMPRALSYLWEILRDGRLNDPEKHALALKFDKILSLNLGIKEKIKTTNEVKNLIKEREDSRKKKDFKTADKIRDKINKLGFIIEDKEKGVLLKKGENDKKN